MIKALLLSSTRLFAPDDETGSNKSEAQKVRDAIKVESVKKDDNQEQQDDEQENKEEIKEDDDEEETEIEEEKKDDDEEVKEVKEEVKAKTPEELEKQIEKLEKTINRLQKRVGRTNSEKEAIAKQLSDAQAALASKVEEGKGLSEEEVERRANLKAEEKAIEREFTKAVQTLNKNATKADKDFPSKIKELTEDIAPIPGAMIGILEDLDNGGEVLAHLADNPDIYEEIYELPPLKMATRLSKLGDKLAEETKPKPKKISKVPDPISVIKGAEKSPTILPANPTKNMDEFVRMRNKQAAERRKARGF